jgi:hypothetical protein
MIVEVTNYHFTRDQKIPSVYLKVFSDRSVECHTLGVTGREADVVKKKELTQDEFKEFLAVVDQSELLGAKKRYELTHNVFDSWMEWDVRIPRPAGVQDIAIAAFTPGSGAVEGFYPNAVVKLGCSISKLRDEVYGDEPGFRRRECKEISTAKYRE